MDKNMKSFSHPLRHKVIYGAWQAERKILGLPDDVKLFIEWAEETGFFFGTYLIGDDETKMWDEIYGLYAIYKNNGEAKNNVNARD